MKFKGFQFRVPSLKNMFNKTEKNYFSVAIGHGDHDIGFEQICKFSIVKEYYVNNKMEFAKMLFDF